MSQIPGGEPIPGGKPSAPDQRSVAIPKRQEHKSRQASHPLLARLQGLPGVEALLARLGRAGQLPDSQITELAETTAHPAYVVLTAQADRQAPNPYVAARMQISEEAHASTYQSPSIPSEQLTPEALERYQMQLGQLNESLAQLLRDRGGNITYDDFFETAIRQYPPELVRFLFRKYQEQSQDVFPGGLDTATADVLVSHIAELGQQYLPLLVDPGIGMGNRPFMFLAFARETLAKEPGLSPLELRRRFIDSFDVKTYYRGEVFEENQSQRELGNLSGGMRGTLIDPQQRSRNYNREIDQILALDVPPEQRLQRLADEGIPFLGGSLRGEATVHILGSATADSPFLSVSEHPEIVYYATCDNSKEGNPKWKAWGTPRRLVISRFSMSSFYALDRTALISGFQRGTYNIGQLHLPISAQGVEALVTIGLPANIRRDQREYSVTSQGPSSIPSGGDWEE